MQNDHLHPVLFAMYVWSVCLSCTFLLSCCVLYAFIVLSIYLINRYWLINCVVLL